MQLVRTLYITKERTFKRKIHEAKLAEELENIHDKRWILNKYLNNAPYGTFGGQTDDRRPGRGARDLRQAGREARAPRVGAARRPAAGAVDVQPVHSTSDGAKRRRNQVLRKMAELGMVQPRDRGGGDRAPARRRSSAASTPRRRESFFFDYVRQELVNKYGADRVRRGGLRIYTTIDLKMQRKAREAINSVAELPEGAEVGDRHRPPGQRQDPRDGLVGELRRDEVQPRRAGPPPAGLDVQDHGPHGRAQARRLARGHVVHVQAAEVQRQALRPDRDQDVRQHVRRADEPRPRDAEVRQLGLHAARPRRRPARRSRRPRGRWASSPSSTATRRRSSAASRTASRRWRWPTPTRRSPRAACATSRSRSRRSRSPTGTPRTSASRAGTARSRTASPRRRRTSWSRTSRAARARRRTSAAPRRARPARPTTTPTRGSWATRRTSRPRCGSASRTAASRCTRRSTPISVAGGTYPSEIWGRYMKGVKRGCGGFPEPKTPFKAAPFFGRYSSTGAPGGPAASRLRHDASHGDARSARDRRRRAGTGGGPAPAAATATAAATERPRPLRDAAQRPPVRDAAAGHARHRRRGDGNGGRGADRWRRKTRSSSRARSPRPCPTRCSA